MGAGVSILERASREASLPGLRDRMVRARAQTDTLFGFVKDGALYDRPIAERHRIIFYVGHLEAFDWNLLKEPLALPSFEPTFDRLFAFGIDPTGEARPADQPADWPDRESVETYRGRVRGTLDRALEGLASTSSPTDLLELLHVAVEHRLMHAETLAYMLHRLPLASKVAAPSDTPDPDESRPSDDAKVEIEAGRATLGAHRAGGAFGWDNEFQMEVVHVPSFAIDRHMVTNRAFRRFVEAGGYEDRSLWSDAAWTWLRREGVVHPLFWEREGERWFYRRMFDRIPLPESWPVYVSHAEATAFTQWVGKALPTEAQWHRAAYGTLTGGERDYPWGEARPEEVPGSFDSRRWDPVSVDAFDETESAFGVRGLVGNGWEWTSTIFHPFTGFAPRPFYPGYSADFFDGDHFVLKGGSPRTAACLLRRSFRNWFQPRYPYVYAGFRCASN